METNKIRAIAFYLPQFFPTEENDEWWEPGFTEWTNVAKAKPLFRGHYQPRIPRDLNFYDLRVPETREKQAQMAREAGIEGFCYWHYWFAGRRLLDRVFTEVVESGKPDFPFCLCWANHSWRSKTWDSHMPDKMLIEQTYPGIEDFKAHFYAMLPAFKDKRYMMVGDKLIFGIFAPDTFPNFQLFAETWNKLAKENGLAGFYFFALAQGIGKLEKFDKKMFDAVILDRLIDIYLERGSTWIKHCCKRLQLRLHRPVRLDYNRYVDLSIETFKSSESFVPCINPDFDHSPRSAYRWIIFENSSPDKWERLCKSTVEVLKKRKENNSLLFIKAWNEWGEGNYLEPDLRWGRAYLEATAAALNI